MVIIKTSATDVSIHAVSPELGVHSVSTLALQAGGPASAGAAAGAAGAAAGAWAYDVSDVCTLNQIPSNSPRARTSSPARISFLNFIVSLLSVDVGRVRASERCRIGFPGADADCLIDCHHEYFAVADLAGFGGGGDGLDNFVDL